MSIPALANITRDYLNGLITDISGSLRAVATTVDADIKASILARIEDICTELPSTLYAAGMSAQNYIEITFAMRTAHTGYCGDGQRRDISSESYEQYLNLDNNPSGVSTATLRDIIASRLSLTLTVQTLSSPTGLPLGSFYRMYRITWK
jgi:hypothetical protein